MVNATDRVYRELRQAILLGELAAGVRLREADLAESLGVSRTPVREALRRLGAEGLAEIDANRGAQVYSWRESDVEEILSVRVQVESYAARLAAQRGTDDQLQVLQGIVDEQVSLRNSRDSESRLRHAELGYEFHRQLLKVANDRHLTPIIVGLVETPALQQAQLRYSRERLGLSADEHAMLVRAISERDDEWAEAIMRQHILAARAEERRTTKESAAARAD